jgi:hypothetical protein
MNIKWRPMHQCHTHQAIYIQCNEPELVHVHVWSGGIDGFGMDTAVFQGEFCLILVLFLALDFISRRIPGLAVIVLFVLIVL